MPTCSSCGEVCEDGFSYVAVTFANGVPLYHWGCEHKLVADAEAYFGSEMCILDWLCTKPQRFHELYIRFKMNTKADCDHDHTN